MVAEVSSVDTGIKLCAPGPKCDLMAGGSLHRSSVGGAGHSSSLVGVSIAIVGFFFFSLQWPLLLAIVSLCVSTRNIPSMPSPDSTFSSSFVIAVGTGFTP